MNRPVQGKELATPIEHFRIEVTAMATMAADERILTRAFEIIENVQDTELVVCKLRDLLQIDHVVYHSSKLGVSPTADPYIRLTYPASWIRRYLIMGYGDIDPVLREGFQRTLPFKWNDLTIQSPAEVSFMADALLHGIGPCGFSIPVVTKQGHRALFSLSFSRSEQEWSNFLTTNRSTLIQIANRVHRRVIVEVFGENRPNLTTRELECLRWIALGKGSNEIGIILHISPHTARDYLKSVRYKLDCVTSAQAASKAINLGLLRV
jgi:LuxR family transcriptional regulator, quorum-sensing system regulator CinR